MFNNVGRNFYLNKVKPNPTPANINPRGQRCCDPTMPLILMPPNRLDLERLDLIVQLLQHWTSKPKVAGSIPTAVKQNVRLPAVAIRHFGVRDAILNALSSLLCLPHLQIYL